MVTLIGRSVFLTAITSVLLVTLINRPAQALSLDNPEAIEAFVDAAVISNMRNNHSASGVVLIAKDGEVILSKGYGYQDIEERIPVDPDKTLFRPGSISKLFTWIAALQLEEQGKLSLDADINEYLTQFEVADTWPGQPVTLRHLMTHRGGFEDGGAGYLILDQPELIMPLAEAMERFQPTRINPPGEHTAYSNWGTAVTGLIVANISGMPFEDYVQRNILDILGMEYATFVEPLPPKLAEVMSKRYGYGGGRYYERPFEIITNFGPAGALSASAGAMKAFGDMLLNGGEYQGRRILKAETVDRFFANEFSHDPRTKGMGLGALQYPYAGVDVVGHDGGTVSYKSHFGLAREEGLMVFTSFTGPGAGTVGRALVWPLYDALYPPEPEDLTPPDDFSERAHLYEGTYHSWRRSFTKIESLQRMLAGIEVRATAENTLMIGGKEFVEVDQHLFHEKDGGRRYVFQADEDGGISGYIMDGIAVAQNFKAPFYETKGFNQPLLFIAYAVLVGVFLRWAYQWSVIKAAPKEERRAALASLFVAAANWLFLVLATYALVANQERLLHEVPTLAKIALVFPILAALGAIYHIYQSYMVWRLQLGASTLSRCRYSVVTLSAVYLVWFYNHWNLVGFNYLV
ncbi:MAG: serine hydrolase [Pseudomonadota bacterium]